MGGHVEHMGQLRNEYSILVERPEGKRLLEITRRRCFENIRMHLREIDWEVVDWIHLAQNREQ
jgi:hypothetical protein